MKISFNRLQKIKVFKKCIQKFLAVHLNLKSDNKGGDLKELTYLGDDENGDPIYEDERELRKYYKPDENGKFLHRFQPIYGV